ncbi:MAG TPA: methyltransferase, partial [Rhodocyclaceae bacterium]|nr:methyltransferase [Rhodocyclaceae bacterium]
AHYQLGNIDQAAAAYLQWLEAEPDNPRARHMYAACLGGQGPTRASDGYLEQTFDAYADSFDNRLISSLGYRGPQMIAQAMQDIVPANKQLTILDGGCGTGLCGPSLAPYAKHLSGVDLSAKMLSKARGLGCYDALDKAELTDHLLAHPGSYDLIAMADTIIYFGDTNALFGATKQALRPGGVVVFTIETLSAAPEVAYQINPSGRYSHAIDHISTVLTQHGFAVESRYKDTLRTEFGHPVPGMVIAARAP